jgi:magnesium transporter
MAGKILSNIEALEDKVFDEKVEATREVTELRHDIANLRRTVFPLKRVIHELEQKVARFSPADGGEEIQVSDYFEALADYFDAVWSIIQECREIIEIYKDTDFVISSDRTNKILALLTIVFTFSIPATVIGTLYGMNVKLPGGAEHPLTFLGPYTTFILILASAFVPVVLMYVVFKKIKWL